LCDLWWKSNLFSIISRMSATAWQRAGDIRRRRWRLWLAYSLRCVRCVGWNPRLIVQGRSVAIKWRRLLGFTRSALCCTCILCANKGLWLYKNKTVLFIQQLGIRRQCKDRDFLPTLWNASQIGCEPTFYSVWISCYRGNTATDYCLNEINRRFKLKTSLSSVSKPRHIKYIDQVLGGARCPTNINACSYFMCQSAEISSSSSFNSSTYKDKNLTIKMNK